MSEDADDDDANRVTLDAKTLGDTIHELGNIFSIVYGTLETMISKTTDDLDKNRILMRTLASAERVQNVIATLRGGMPKKPS